MQSLRQKAAQSFKFVDLFLLYLRQANVNDALKDHDRQRSTQEGQWPSGGKLVLCSQEFSC